MSREIPAVVKLSLSEVRGAAYAGIERRLRAIHNNRQHAHGAEAGPAWEFHIVGTLGEFVAAKAFGYFWNGGDPKLDHAGDVERLQIRSTDRPDGQLILHPTDPDNAVFVLVAGGPCTFYLAGWLPGAEAKQQKRWKDYGNGRPAFFTPQSALRPMSELQEDDWS